jgi:catechol 2,3-dioxygenase-like lactoylglutathione lyase family enzyme
VSIQNVATVLPVPDLAEGVAFWREVLGVEPTFVDGDRWAQFDVHGSRIALAGTDRFADAPSLMLKSVSLDAAREAFRVAGADASEIVDGAHERRFTATTPGGTTVAVYTPR